MSHVNTLKSRELFLNMAGREENEKLKGDHDANFYNELFLIFHVKCTHGNCVAVFMIKRKKLIRGEKNY